MKFVFIFFIILSLNNCSLNKDSKYWTEDVVKKSEDKKKLSKTLKKSDDITNMTYDEYKIYIDLEKGATQSKIIKTLTDFYKKDDFVKILKANTLLSTNDVINSNNCFISVCKSKYKNKIVIISAIDNLIKGGAGQAIQNLNMKFNFPIKTAL